VETFLAGAAVIAALALAKRLEKRRRKPPPTEPLDTPLFGWSERDPFTRRELVRSVSIMGSAGSGKTSGSGFQIGRAAVRDRGIGGLIIASKPEDRGFWQGIFEGAGRADDLITFGPGHPHAFNFIDFEKGDTRDITQNILTVAETLSRMEGGHESPFWKQGNQRAIHNGVEVLRSAGGRLSTWDLQRFINGAATSGAMLHDETWRAGEHNRILGVAIGKANTGTDSQRHDIDLAAKEFFLNEWPVMAEQTRSGILAGVMGILHVYNTGIVRELISGHTTITPEVMDEGKWVLVDCPVSVYGISGAFIAGAWKYATQRHILRRQATANSPITVIWIDEYQNHATSFDFKFLSECRSHKGCMVVLTQSLHSYFASIGGKEAHSHTKGLLTNFGTQIFHSLGDSESADYASSLIGRTLTHLGGGQIQRQGVPFDEFIGNSPMSTSWSQHYESLVQGRAFMTNLRTGGPDCDFMTDAWVLRNGRAFSNGYNHMLIAFSQR